MPKMKKDFTDLDGRFPKLRREYHFGKLERRDLAPDPFAQFAKWFVNAVRQEQKPNAMTLATMSKKKGPSARIILLKGFDQKGFTFYTNYRSRKAKDIVENPKAEAVFYWPASERQVRIRGTISRLSGHESRAYFRSRPFASRIASWASEQSRILKDRKTLEAKIKKLIAKFKGRDIPLPPFWGGYRLRPSAFEFWQGRGSRLNDRFLYRRKAGRRWRIERLQP